MGQKPGHQVTSKENLVNTEDVTIFIQSSLNLVRRFTSIIYSSTLNMDQLGSITGSAGKNQMKTFFTIFLLLSQNVNLNDINVKFEYGSAWVKN